MGAAAQSLLFDISWVVGLRSEALTPVFRFFSALGYGGFILVFLPLGYWLIHRRVFARLTMLVLFTILLNGALKDLFMDPRPNLALRLDGLVGTSYGRPSGHAQIALVMWPWLAFELRRRWLWIVAGITSLGVCASRIYLGVHDLDDVITGAALGLLTLFVFQRLRTRFAERWMAQGATVQLSAVAVVTAFFLVTWPGGAPVYVFGAAGSAFGFWGGVLGNRGGELRDHPATWLTRIAALSLGFGALIALRMSLRSFEWEPGASANAAQLITGAILGFYVAWLAPFVFGRIGLLTPAGVQAVASR